MQAISSTVPPGDEADVESEGGTVLRNSGSSKDAKVTPKPQATSRKSSGELPNDKEEENGNENDDADEGGEDEDADEETFAVEKVLDHSITKKENVTPPSCCIR